MSALPPPSAPTPPPPSAPTPPPPIAPTPAPAAAAPRNVNVIGHLRRASVWRLDRIRPSPSEIVRLSRDGEDDPTVQSYAVWRRSALLIALPVVTLTAVLAMVSFKDVETGDPFNSLGVIAQICPLLGPITLAVALWLSLASWSKSRYSSRVLVFGWVTSVVLPLLPALMPLDWLIDKGRLVERVGDVDLVNQQLLVAKIILGVQYAIFLLPTVITFPGGVVKGSVRVKGLLPDSSLPGFFLVTTAPFYSLIVLVALVIVVQFFGTGLLLLGALLLAVSPWVYVFHRRHYIGAVLDDSSSAQLDKAQRLNGVLTLAGLGFIMLWAFTANIDGVKVVSVHGDGVLDLLTVSRVAVESVARSFATTVVFAHIFLSLTISAWRSAVAVRNDPRLPVVDARNEAVARAMSSSRAEV
jgi:hypothetical protein